MRRVQNLRYMNMVCGWFMFAFQVSSRSPGKRSSNKKAANRNVSVSENCCEDVVGSYYDSYNWVGRVASHRAFEMLCKVNILVSPLFHGMEEREKGRVPTSLF